MTRPMRGALGLAALTLLGGAVPAAVGAPEPARIAVVPVEVGTTETLLDIAFPDAKNGYAVGTNGAILATTDGGVTWARQRSGVEISPEEVAARTPGQRAPRQPVDLSGVWFASPRQGWAVGTNTVLTTSDGGARWAALKLPAIDAIPGDGPGRLGQPTRAANWDLQAVRFSDGQRGVVVGGGGTVLVTADGGTTWSWKGDRRFGDLGDVSFADGANGQAVGLSGGGVGQLSVSVATTDAGATWVLREATGVGGEVVQSGFAAVATPTVARAYVAGAAGRIFVTVDSGQRWSVQRRDTTERFQGMAFASTERGIAVGLTDFSGTARASLVATDDGGEAWVGRLLEGEILWDVAFASPSTAYAVGCRAHLSDEDAVRVVQADGMVAEQFRPCQQTLLLRISFAPQDGAAGGGGGFSSLVVGGGIGLALAALALLVRRGRRRQTVDFPRR